MAINASRDMNAELEQGIIDGRYIQLAPMRGGVFTPPVDRLSWPTYAQAEQHRESTFLSHAQDTNADGCMG